MFTHNVAVFSVSAGPAYARFGVEAEPLCVEFFAYPVGGSALLHNLWAFTLWIIGAMIYTPHIGFPVAVNIPPLRRSGLLDIRKGGRCREQHQNNNEMFHENSLEAISGHVKA